MKNKYQDRDPDELAPEYSEHVQAMTTEGLHSKAAIAAELAVRDRRIKALEKMLNYLVAEVRNDHELGRLSIDSATAAEYGAECAQSGL